MKTIDQYTRFEACCLRMSGKWLVVDQLAQALPGEYTEDGALQLMQALERCRRNHQAVQPHVAAALWQACHQQTVSRAESSAATTEAALQAMMAAHACPLIAQGGRWLCVGWRVPEGFAPWEWVDASGFAEWLVDWCCQVATP